MFLDTTTSVLLYLLSYIISFIFCNFYFLYSRRIYNSKFISILLLILTALPFSLLCGYRGEYTGFDTQNYINGFLNMKYGIEVINDGSFDFLFRLVRYYIYILFGENIFLWLFILAFCPILIINYSFFLSSRRMVDYSFSCLLFLLYLSPIMMDQSRQFVAVGLVALAFVFLKENRIKYFVIIIIISTLIHESSLIMFLFLFFRKNTLFEKYSWLLPIIVIVFTFFMLDYTINFISAYMPKKFEYIGEQIHIQSSGLAWLVDVTPMLFVMFLYYKYRRYKNSHCLPLELCALSALPFRLAGYSSFFIMRLSYYGEVVSIILFCELLSQISKRKAFLFISLSIIIFSLRWYIGFVLLEFNAAIPYSTVK